MGNSCEIGDMNTNRDLIRRCLGVVVAALGVSFSSVASAQLMGISVNFQGSGAALSSTDVAGVAPLDNWNNIYTTASWTNLTSPNLIDSAGDLTGVKFTVNYGYSSAGVGNQGPNSGDDTMLGGSMVFTNGATINLSNISYAMYDLYVYVGPGESGKIGANYNGSVRVGSTTYYYQNLSSATDFVVSTDTTGPANISAQADYVKFSDLTGSSLSIVLNGYNYNNTGIYGFQIIAVPEPSVYALLAGGGLMLTALRMRAKRRV